MPISVNFYINAYKVAVYNSTFESQLFISFVRTQKMFVLYSSMLKNKNPKI